MSEIIQLSGLSAVIQSASRHFGLGLGKRVELVPTIRRNVPMSTSTNRHDPEKGLVIERGRQAEFLNVVIHCHATTPRLTRISLPESPGVVQNFCPMAGTGAGRRAQDMSELEIFG